MSVIRKILIPTQFEELSLLVVREAAHLKEAGLEEIVFLHVIERDEVSFHRYEGLDEKLVTELRERAELRFADWESSLAPSGVRCRSRVEIGNVVSMILRVSEEEDVDLILAGRQHETPLDRVYLSGKSMDIVRNARCPVMICKPHNDDDHDEVVDNPFRRILFATDFSDVAERAKDFLKSLDGACQALDVVHVLNDRDLSGHNEEGVAQIRTEAQQQLDALCADLSALKWKSRCHLLAGSTASEILRASRDYDSTLIVMGTTGKHGLAEMWLGSASHRVVELSVVPVVLVPRAR